MQKKLKIKYDVFIAFIINGSVDFEAFFKFHEISHALHMYIIIN